MIQSMRVSIGIVAVLVLALAVAVHIASVVNVDVEASYPQVWWMHVTSMVLCGAALLFTVRIAGPKPRLGDLIATIPLWALTAIIAALVYVFVNFFLLVPATGAGDPVLSGGRYFFNDHGTMREVSEGAFHAQRAVSLRLYSGVWVYLCLTSTVLLLMARPRQVPKTR